MRRVVIITGVLGGIGSAAAKVFNEAGWHVFGIDIRETFDLPYVSDFICADISDAEVPQKIIDEVSFKKGRLDALVNNAAIQICKPLLETSVDDWEKIMATNVRSAFLIVQAAHPVLKKSQGSIVNVGSVHAFATSRGIGAYAASKGALLALTRSIALEMAEDGIRANVMIPGAVETDMLRKGLSRGHIFGENVSEQVNNLGLKHPLGRIAQPEEIAKSIYFLADNHQSSFITGQALTVDGGALAKLSTE